MIRHYSLRLRARGFMYVRVRLLATIFVMLLAVALAAPSAVAQTTTPQYLFLTTNVPNGQGGSVRGIITYTVDTTTGALTQITPPPVQTRGAPGALAINNAGTFLFAVATNSAGQGAVESFSVASDGSLTEVGTSPYTISNPQAAPVAIAVSPNGAYLYVASSVPFNESTEAPESAILDVFAVAADGSLTLSNTFAYSAVDACNPPTPALLFPVQLYVHPTQKWLYLFMGSSYGPPCSGQPSEVQLFTINSDGTLTAPGAPSILPLYATNGYALTGSPDGTLLFLMTKQNPENGIIYASGIDQSTGEIGFVLVYSYPPAGATPLLSTGGLAVDSTSTYLYSSAGTFLMQDGNITALDSSSSPYTVGASLLASPSLPFIFAQATPADSGFYFLSDQVNSDGSLTPAPGSPYTFSASGMVLSGAAPIPTKAVMWINPDGPINITGVTVGQTGSGGVSISNPGYGPLTITSVTVTGDPSLTPLSQCTSPIAPQGNCSTGVNFAPTSVGTFTGTLTIESSAGTRTFAISATSVAPPPLMPDPILIAPSPILFPDTATGSSSPLTYQLQNGATATEPMTVSSITIVGSNPGDFSATSNCTSAPIAVGSSCSITITFAPQALGGRAASLSINGPTGVLTGATLTGTAVTTVTKFTFSTSVTGPGTITQSPTGTSFPNNTTITLTETPNANSSFVNWTGATCTRAGVTTCTIVLNSNTAATANFVTNINFNVAVVGSGTVMQSPLGTSFAPGTSITLVASPNTGAQFVSWSPASACTIPSGTPTECFANPTTNTTITATFSGGQFSLATNIVGPGTIMQSPTGTSFASGTALTLTAVPNSGATFTSWSGGACNGSTSATCAFNISANTSVTATFTSPPVVTTPTPSQTGAAGGSFTFPLSATGFSTTPTYTASCSIPAGSCTINGTMLVVTTTARTASVEHQVTAWVGPSSGAGNRRRGSSGDSAAGRVSVVGVAETLLAMLAGIVLVPLAKGRGATAVVRLRRMAPALAAVIAFAGLALLVACGGSGSGGTMPTGTPAGTYTVTVTAKAGTQTATTNVSVIVQ